MIDNNPLISVILPVYNGANYLKEAIDSILNQTYVHFELIIINDGSKDNSESIIKEYNDSRIRYFYKDNTGLAETLNFGIKHANGFYIARQDQDDISYRDRFEKQVEYLEENLNVVLLGTRARIISQNEVHYKWHNHAINSAELKFDLLFDNPFVHSTIMFRKKTLDKIGIYNTDRAYYEDYEFWSRFSEIGDVANLKDVLLDYRHHENGLSKTTNYFNEDAVFKQSLRNIETLMGYKDPVFIEIASLMHDKKLIYKGISKKIIDQNLKLISDKIIQKYPNQKDLITNRLAQYKGILSYRINMINRIKCGKYSLKLLLLRIEYRIFRYQKLLINK